MRVDGIQYSYFYTKEKRNNLPLNFLGTTKFYSFTDIHQNADKHCKLINGILKFAKKNKNVVVLDNGDIFKGIYPKKSIVDNYLVAKKINPDIEFVYNVGNNDPGYDSIDKKVFHEYVKKLNDANVHVISANIVDENTGRPIPGIKPYTVIERDGDKLLYTGFVVNKIVQRTSGMASKDVIQSFRNIADEIKAVMKKEHCKGFVILLHDTESIALRLKEEAAKYNLFPEFIIGGHVHHPYINPDKKIYYPEPFGASMLNLDLKINDREHKISKVKEIPSFNYGLGVFKKDILSTQKEEGYFKPIARSITELGYNYEEKYGMEATELGTFYADGIKKVSNSDVGLVPKSWIYDTFPKKTDGYVNKMDILISLPQPFKSIKQLNITSEELKRICQDQINYKNRIFEASQNFEMELNSNREVVQIKIDGKPLFDENGKPINPKRKFKVAIDYNTLKGQNYDGKDLDLMMYDGIVQNFKTIEKTMKENEHYPISKIIINN